MPAVLTSAQLARDLAITDLSDPAEGPPHAIQLLAGLAVSALTSAWGCAARWCRGPRIVTIADNYDHLGYLASAVTREASYTRYVDDTRVLRSHSTAMVPPALRQLADDPPDDVLLVCPGIVYRRDAIDWQHSPTPHQLDLWRISREPLGEDAMHEMITVLLGALAPGRVRKGIPDIRLLRSADARVASQMLGLAPYRPVSAMPAVRRDLSVAVDAETDDEILGDRIREALGADADAVEDVAILSSTAWEDLPGPAAARLGARPGQRNVLVRVVLRHLERTLTDGEANSLRDRIYAAVHQGTSHQWAVVQRPRGLDARAGTGAGRRP
jgi:phenylalanyl-tRNA synthetase alpha chain